jgi:hypothetical protein
MNLSRTLFQKEERVTLDLTKTNTFKIFIAFIVFGSFAVGAILYIHGEIEKELEKRLSNIEELKYKELKCMGLQEIVCHLHDVEVLQNEKTIIKIKDVSFQDVKDGLSFDQDKNGTLPFKLNMNKISFTKDAEIEELMDKEFNSHVIGTIAIFDNEKFLNISEFEIEDKAFIFGTSFDIKVENEKNIFLKSASFSFANKEANGLENIISRIAKSNRQTVPEFETEFKENLLKLHTLGSFGKDSAIAIEKFVFDENTTKISYHAETKSSKYLNIMEFYLKYVMTASLAGAEAGDKILFDTFNISVETE